MGRAPCCDKANVKRGPWSPEEDAILKTFVEQNGTGGNWIALPQKAGLRRCGKSCRLRWLNYLRPDIKHGGFSEDEDNIICRLYSSIGSRWSIIAAQLPGRTDNDIKNYWNTRLKKKLLGKGARDDQQTRRLLAKEAAAAREMGMIFNSTSPTINGSEAHMSVSNTPSPSVSLTDPGKQQQQLIHSPYAIEAGNNVPMLLQDPTSSVSSESPPLSNSAGFHVGPDHYEKGLKQIPDYSSFTSILMRAIESNNNKTESSTDIPPLLYPTDAQDALYAAAAQAPLCVNVVKAETGETFDQNDSPLGFSMSHWGTCTSSGLWMNEVNNGQDPSFSYGFTGDQMNELAYSNSSSSMQIKEEPDYGVTTTDTAAYWFSQLAAASAADPKSYSYILPSEGNSNSTAQGIFQEGIIY